MLLSVFFHSLMCTSVKRYDEPYNWPICVPFCGALKAPHDDKSAMYAVEMETTVPIGKAGQYRCNDSSQVR